MYMQNGITAAVSTGPQYREPEIDPAERMAELDKVIAMATATMPKATMRKLGTLSFAVAKEDDDCSYFGQIRSEPIGSSGLEFRFPMPARDTGKKDLNRVAAQLVGAAITVVRVASKVNKHTGMVREMAEQVIARGTGGIASMRIVGIGITPELPGFTMRSTIDVEMLGSDLEPSVDRVVEHDFDSLEAALVTLVDRHLARRKALAQARVGGVIGWIDDAASITLEAAGVDVGEILRMLSVDPEVEFSFGGEHGYDTTAAFFWVDGTIKAFVENRTRGSTFRLRSDQLAIEMPNVPATLLASLVGRRLRDVVDLRFIPETAIIVDMQESGEWLYLDLEVGRSTIEKGIATAA